MRYETNSRKLIEEHGWRLVEDHRLPPSVRAPGNSGETDGAPPKEGSPPRLGASNLPSSRPDQEVSSMRYAVFIHKDPDSAYGVIFPEVPGCFSAGGTIEEAMNNAVEALALHVRGIEADGEPVPKPRPLDEIMRDPEFAQDREGAVIASVPLVRDLGSTTRINVSLDLGLLEAIDSEARHRKQTRSAFIASAVRKELTE